MNNHNRNSSIEEKLCLIAEKNIIPLSVTFELTPHCNMHCSMCYIRLNPKKQQEMHPLCKVDEWLHLAKQLKEMGTLFILLTGGEPLLYPEFSKLYIELIKMGFIVTVNSNGTLITEDIATMLRDYFPRRVNVTIYGANNETYEKVTGNNKGYDQTIRGIQLLKKYNIPIKLNCSMIKMNKEDTPKIIDISEELNIPLEYNTYMFPCSRYEIQNKSKEFRVTPEDAAKWDIYIKKHQRKNYFSEIKDNLLHLYNTADSLPVHEGYMKCRAGKSSCWINWKGEMTPCVFLDEPTIDLTTNSVQEAWKRVNEMCNNIRLPNECNSCKHRFSCNICAASVRWENQGDFFPVIPQLLYSVDMTIL